MNKSQNERSQTAFKSTLAILLLAKTANLAKNYRRLYPKIPLSLVITAVPNKIHEETKWKKLTKTEANNERES